MKTSIPPVLITFAFVCFALVQNTQAVSPAPDGGYPGGNTAEGQGALLSLTTGGFNTAVGFFSLRSDTTGSFNTAIGAGTLLANTADANTAVGAFALFSNTNAVGNTAVGNRALQNNTGLQNTATGAGALPSNTTGSNNTANGLFALENNTTGTGNTAVGVNAGQNATTGDGNVYIGAGLLGVAGESHACYIASIFGQTSASGIQVFINNNNKLGTSTSSKRFKEEIKPMESASEALFALKPVTFRYKKELDPQGIQQWGLVAEDVQRVNAALVAVDKEGKPYSVRYDQVNAMLLNEFLKEHRKVEELTKNFESKLAEQQKQIERLTAGLQKVSAQLEASKPAPQVVKNP
jgi:hypothetical protein